MQFGIDTNHLRFFYTEHHIAFEDLITPDDRAYLKNCFREGTRNPHSSDPRLEKIALNRHLARIAALLTKEKKLRLGYTEFTSSTIPLHTNSSIRPIKCGVFIHLDSSLVTYLDSHTEFPYDDPTPGFLITYSTAPIYTFNDLDPHNHQLKTQGLVFGDSLPHSTNPVLTS